MTRVLHWALACTTVAALTTSCGSSARTPALGGAPGDAARAAASAPAGRSRTQRVILADEIAEHPTITNAYDLVERLRPAYLRSASMPGTGAVQLRVDGGPQRELNDLRNIDVRHIQEIRYYTPQEANVRFGIDTNSPVIAVTMKRLP